MDKEQQTSPVGRENSETAQQVLKDFNKISGDRGNFENLWREIAERIDPVEAPHFSSRSHGHQSKGNKRTTHIYDSTPTLALQRFSAILDSLLTPRNQKYQRLRPSDPALAKNREVRLYFEEATQALFRYRYAPKANFSDQNHRLFKNIGGYGNGVMFTDQLDKARGLRYRSIHLGEAYFRENHQGIVDEVYRHFPMTARQAVQKWGNKVPKKIQEVEKQFPDREFFFIHCVKPRLDIDPTRRDFRGMPFVSYYVSVEGCSVVEERGYTSFPYSVSRYDKSSNEVYGRSPAMHALPAIKTLYEEKKTVLKQGHRTVDPVLLAHDDGVIDSLSLRPGAINYGGVSADGKALVQTLPVGRVDIGKDLMDDERAVINDFFLVTLFQILTETPTMTATEVMERIKEKGILLAPTVSGFQDGYLGPLTERELDLLALQGILGPMPQILREAAGEYTIEYDSPLSRAQRAEEAAGLMRSIEMSLQVVNVTQNPAILDHYNWDVIIPEINEIHGVPARWLRAVEDVQQIRMGRAEQMEREMAAREAPGQAALVKAGSVAQQSA